MSVNGLRESRRGELGKELVGSHPSQDRLYHWFKSNDYGRILSDNNAYIKDKRMVCLSYRSEFEVIRNFCVPQVITVMDTEDVTIDNLAIDASHNTVASCDIGLSAVHFYNASGRLKNSAVFGAQLPNPQSCSTFFGNGFGVVVDSSETGPFDVEIEHNSIHDFQRDGIEVSNAGVNVEIEGNNISGLGPSTGINQFGIFLLNGAVGQVKDNVITEGACGTLSP